MAEWFKAPVLKTGMGASPSWVRIPLSPPILPLAGCTNSGANKEEASRAEAKGSVQEKCVEGRTARLPRVLTDERR